MNRDSFSEVGSFLARRWSGNTRLNVDISEKTGTRTRLSENRIILYPPNKRPGDGFAQYRQFRMDVWYESMKVRFCSRILSRDHAFGFVLDMLEERRVESLGRRMWRGMDNEIMFCQTYRFLSRPPLTQVYGRAKILEAFYQHFMFGAFRGEVQTGHFQRVARASKAAGQIIRTALEKDLGTDWMEKRAGEIVRILDIDSLQTVPISLPFIRQDIPVNRRDVTRFLGAVKKNREGDFGRTDPAAVLAGESVSGEYRTVAEEAVMTERKESVPGVGGIRTPASEGVDESVIYDADLITGLKTRFRRWKNGYSEVHRTSGDELDVESHLDGHKPFITDERLSIKSHIVILLDHSSSISADAVGYKKATLGLCEVLSYLEVRFAVYAFSTMDRSVVCWLIKNEESGWGRLHARRLAGIVANGSTPLAQVYQKMLPALQARPPDIFLTLTDGEPSDPAAVRDVIRSVRSGGVRMVALGLGPSTSRATTIASNLKRLGYERTLATSRLQDIPRKVLSILDEGA